MLSVSFYGSGWKVNADGSFRIYAIWFYILYMTFDVIASIQSSCVFDCVCVIVYVAPCHAFVYIQVFDGNPEQIPILWSIIFWRFVGEI